MKVTFTFARAEQAIKTFTEIRDARHFDEEASLICAVAEIEEAEAVRRKEQASELADRIVAGFMSPALATSAADWHVRYRFVNRAAGIIAGAAVLEEDSSAATAAQGLVTFVGARFAGGPRPSDPGRVQEWEDRNCLQAGLCERVAATLVELGE